jgi:hypothetical protein
VAFCRHCQGNGDREVVSHRSRLMRQGTPEEELDWDTEDEEGNRRRPQDSTANGSLSQLPRSSASSFPYRPPSRSPPPVELTTNRSVLRQTLKYYKSHAPDYQNPPTRPPSPAIALLRPAATTPSSSSKTRGRPLKRLSKTSSAPAGLDFHIQTPLDGRLSQLKKELRSRPPPTAPEPPSLPTPIPPSSPVDTWACDLDTPPLISAPGPATPVAAPLLKLGSGPMNDIMDQVEQMLKDLVAEQVQEIVKGVLAHLPSGQQPTQDSTPPMEVSEDLRTGAGSMLVRTTAEDDCWKTADGHDFSENAVPATVAGTASATAAVQPQVELPGMDVDVVEYCSVEESTATDNQTSLLERFGMQEEDRGVPAGVIDEARDEQAEDVASDVGGEEVVGDKVDALGEDSPPVPLLNRIQLSLLERISPSPAPSLPSTVPMRLNDQFGDAFGYVVVLGPYDWGDFPVCRNKFKQLCRMYLNREVIRRAGRGKVWHSPLRLVPDEGVRNHHLYVMFRSQVEAAQVCSLWEDSPLPVRCGCHAAMIPGLVGSPSQY